MAAERLTPERRRSMTRAALVEAAAEVFAEKGFHGASLEEIAERAGFTRGAIYSNFGNREDLLLAVMDHYDDVVLNAYTEAMDTEGELDATMRAAAAAGVWARGIGASRELMKLSLELRLQALRDPQLRPRLAKLHRESTEKVVRLIEEEIARHGWKLRMPARDLAVITLAAADGLVQRGAVDTDDTEYYDRLVQAFFVMIAQVAVEVPGDEAG